MSSESALAAASAATAIAATTTMASAAASLASNNYTYGLERLSSMTGNISEAEELKLLNFPSKREDLSTAIPLTVIFALLLVTGCIGNMCTAIVIARPKNKYMHTATNYYLFSLAMSDFLFLILGLPQEMYTLWQRYPYAFGEAFCIMRGYLSEASTYASILTISAFTVERYVAICHPLWAHTMSQLPRAITSIVIIWLLAAICAIPPAAELGIVTQRGPLTNRTLEQSAQCATKRTIYENMFVVSAIVFFIVPMIIVTVLYILIAIELRRSSKMNAAISKQTSSQLHHNNNASSTANTQRAVVHHKHSLCYMHKSLQLHVQDGAHWRANKCASPSGSLAAPMLTVPAANDEPLRPSSAIGTERPSCNQLVAPHLSAPVGQVRAPIKWLGSNLLLFRTQSQQQQQQQQQRLHCRCCSAAGVDNEPSVSVAPNGRPVPAHSPLSYHESLIQRPAAADNMISATSDKQTSANNNNNIHQGGRLECLAAAAAARAHARAAVTKSAGPKRLAAIKSLNQQCAAQHYQLHQHQQHHCTSAVVGTQVNNNNNNKRATGASSKKSVIRMLVAVVVSFFICWLPFHAQRLLASYLVKDENQNQFLLDIYLKLTYISGVMYYLSSTINPLLYQLMSAKFRLAFKETFNCSLFRCVLPKRYANGLAGRSPSNSLKTHNNGQICSGCCCCCDQTASAPFGSKVRSRLHASLSSLLRINTPAECCVCQPSGCQSMAARPDSPPDRRCATPAHGGGGNVVLKLVRPQTQQCAPSLTRLSSRDEDETQQQQQQQPVCEQLQALIRPASSDRCHAQPAFDNIMTTPSDSSGRSSGSSPADQLLMLNASNSSDADNQKESNLSATQQRQQQQRLQQQLLMQQRARRRSLQQTRPHDAHWNIEAMSRDAARKSSSSSQTNEPKAHHIVSQARSNIINNNNNESNNNNNDENARSLYSSSERHLHKKLSLSTTTSGAMDDCTGSLITTHSQLTAATSCGAGGCGSSNPALNFAGLSNTSTSASRHHSASEYDERRADDCELSQPLIAGAE